MTSTGARPASRSTTSHFVTRSRRYAPAATPKTTAVRRARRFTAARGLPPGLGLRVLDAELRVRERLQPRLLDRLAAPHADAERALVPVPGPGAPLPRA